MEDKEIILLRTILEGFVGMPGAITINKTADEMGVMLTVDVAKTDKGLVIGKEGETINAIRKIMKCVGMKNRARISVKLNEPERSERSFSTPWPSNSTVNPFNPGF